MERICMDQRPADPDDWRGPVNSVLYTIQFTPELDHTKAVELAGAIQAQRVLRGDPSLYRTAIRDALAQGEPLGNEIPTEHAEPDLRAFLQDLHDTLGEHQN
jgi:hypothetical protein